METDEQRTESKPGKAGRPAAATSRIGWAIGLVVLIAYLVALFRISPITFSGRNFRFFPIPIGGVWGESLAVGFVVLIASWHLAAGMASGDRDAQTSRPILKRLTQIAFATLLFLAPSLIRLAAVWIAGHIGS